VPYITRLVAIAAVAFATLVTSTPALAQGSQTGILQGRVTDQEGLVLPGATVTVTSPNLQGARTVVTDETGSYIVRGLPSGRYHIRIELSGMTPIEQDVDVRVGAPTEVNGQLRLGTLTETVTVTADVTPSALSTTQVGINIRQEQVEALATPRTIQGIATLSPGLTEDTPNANQVTISGAFAYDNLMMVDGVDISDNVFGSPNNLFIEDAIQDTQVLTSGVSAEYGRFTGGVINAVTKSGGNDFSGSFRINLQNPAWIQETPFQVESGTENNDQLNDTYEATFGGPILRDRLWFFSAGRLANTADNPTLPITGISFDAFDNNKRGEIKLTGTIAQNHTIEGSYLNNSREVRRAAFAFTIDPNSIEEPSFPNTRYVTNWRGVLGPRLFAEAQYSRKTQGFRGAGGTATDIVESPIITLTQELAAYNAPYFDATDPEDRNNQQITGSLAYAADWRGRHDIKGGTEWYQSNRTGGNSQTATGYVFNADFATDANGDPLLDADGRLIPVFVPGDTLIENWLATRGAEIDINTLSFYIQDRWSPTPTLTLDLGTRYERVRSEATGGIIGVDTDTIVPRLGATFDPTGDGRVVLQATYGHYAGKYNESQFGNNTNVGNPNFLGGFYTGPAGQGRDFAAGFNPANYEIDTGDFPTANVFFEEGLSSPIVREWTLQAGTELGREGYLKAVYINRNWSNFVEDFVTPETGATTIVQNGIDFGTFDNNVYRNSDDPVRRYQAVQLQSRYDLSNAFSLNAHWTIQLQNEGNFEGEGVNTPGISSAIGDYPEIRDPERHFPVGRNDDFQRHRVRVWGIHNWAMERFGTLTSSLMWRYEGAQAYSLNATNVAITPQQRAILTSLGYQSVPSPQTIYFGRGTGLFDDYSLFDVSVNYQIPLWQQLRPWVKLDLFNIFNYNEPYQWNTAIRLDPDSPRDALGIPTGFIEGASFGQPTRSADYPRPYGGEVGGRVFRMAFGLRF
jgi:hypothetical protein